jgi:glycosyltransferase involved in cell wall biosynthesis
VPYVNIAATVRLWEEARVPYAIDFRDGWSIDVIGGEEAFPRDSVQGRWESKVLANALSLWCVNEPIAQHYRDRYPEMADRIEVVRNGFDADSVPTGLRQADPAAGLTFGYLGSINFPPAFLATALDAWREARRRDPIVARSRFDVRGHIGAGSARHDTTHSELLAAAAADGVVFGGPVPKAQVADVYNEWDVLVLMLVGGRFVTSGKVYEVLATGRPVVSVHEADHDAGTVLAGSPMWTGAVGLDVDRLADAFVRGAHLAIEATPEQHALARAMSARYTRPAQVEPAVRRLTEKVRMPA